MMGLVSNALRRLLTTGSQSAGLEQLFTEEAAAAALARRLALRHPSEVGRHRSQGAAILDVASWLEGNGWGDCDRAWLQCYALWLLHQRAAYEKQRALIS